MPKIFTYILTITLSFLIISCESQFKQKPAVEGIEATAGLTPVPLWQGDVPGPAPNFTIQQREQFNILIAFRDPAFIRTALSWIRRLQPSQGGTIWLSALIVFLVAIDHRNPKSWKNLDFLCLLIPSIFLVDVTILGNTQDSVQSRLFSLLYLGLFLSTLILLIRSVIRAYKSRENKWISSMPKNLLVGLTTFFLLINVMRTLLYRPNDSGTYTNIGAYHILNTGKLPYGDENLRGGAAATYGPLLYISHIPFQLALKPIINQFRPGEESILRKVIIGGDDLYHRGPPSMATKLTVLFFQFLAIIGLILIGCQISSPELGWALALLYASSPYVMGLGGENAFIGGLTYISHIAPTAITILAYLNIRRPLISGSLIAFGAGMLFYPAFLFPLWLGYYYWKREPWAKFVAGFTGVIIITIVMVLLLTNHVPGESPLKILYDSTIGHQEARDAYGSSTFSFWSTQPGLAAFWQKTLIQDWHLLRPSVIVFAIFIVSSFFMARRRNLAQLAFLTAAVLISVQVWKSHAGGTYIEWYYPFFLIGLLYPSTNNSKEMEFLSQSSEAASTQDQIEPKN